MADSNNRVRIDFDVNAQELKEITSAINILEKFNRQAAEVIGAVGKMGNAFENSNKKTKQAKDGYVSLAGAMDAWEKKLKSNQTMMTSYEAMQAKLTQKLSSFGRDVKVTVDQTGKLSASFKNAEGNMVSMTGKYDALNNEIKKMKTSLSTVSNEVQKKAEADKKAAQQMDRLHASALKMNRELDNQKRKYQELTRGTDLARVLRANGNAFDVYNNAIKANGVIVRASMDRNGRFNQTLRMQDGTLRTITGYYDRVNKKLVQYSDSISRASTSTNRAESSVQRFSRQLTTLERSMQGLNKYTLTWSEAIEIATTRMLQWNVAGTIVFGLQRAFKSLLATMIEIDSQMIQLMRVLPDTTNFNEMMEDSIRLSTEFGRTLTDINEGLITFARSGFDNVDTRFLTEAATLMANVSDIDMNDASETLTSAITLFNVKARDSISIVNKLNQVDNDYSISTVQLAKSIARAGGTAASFGVTLDELIGHTTAIGVATRESGQIIGNGLKSIYSRINTLDKARGAIEELGVALIDPATGDNRNVGDIMDDIAKKWPELNNAQKQNTAINVAGTYQLNRFLAMMNNYKMGLDATKTAQHSYNSAVKENAKFMQGIQAKINLLTSAWQQFAAALGKAGAYEAIHLVLEGLINLTQGLTDIVSVFGKFSFAIPVAVAALGIFAAQYAKTRTEMLAFQMTMIGLNTNLSRQAFMMTTTASTSTVLSGAFATLRAGALGLTAALLTNPLTWIAVAAAAIPMLVGHFKRLREEMEALHKRAEDNTKAFKDFKKEIADKTVSQSSIDVFNDKAKAASKTIQQLKKDQQESKDAQVNMNVAYMRGGATFQTYTNWQDKLSKKTKNELADIGIKYDKYKSIESLMKAVKSRQEEYSGAVEAGNSVLKESKKQLMFHADAFDEVGDSVKETMDQMELFFGVNDQMVQELIGSYNTIMVLTNVKKKDAAQTQALDQAWEVWENRLGMTREELMKHPEKMKENIQWQTKMKDKWGEATQKILSNEKSKQLAVDITKQKTKEAAQETANAEREAAEKKAKAAEKEAERKAKAFGEFRKNMQINETMNLGMTRKEVANATLRGDFNKKSADKSILAMKGENKQSDSTKTAYEKLKSIQNKANDNRRKHSVDSVVKINKSLKDEMKQAGVTATGHKTSSDKIMKAIKTQKDSVIRNASAQNKEHKRLSKEETGSVARGWGGMWDTISKIMGWIKNLFGIKSSSSKSPSGSLKGSGIDRYAEGTSASGHGGGPAIVGEEGPELAHIPNMGTTIVGARGPEFLNLPKGTSVLPNKQTEMMLKSYGFPGYANGVGNFFDAITKGPKAVWDSAVGKFGLSDGLLPSWFNKLAGSPVKAIGKMAVNKIKSMLDGAIGSFGKFAGGGAKMAQAAIMTALRIMNKPISWLGPMMSIAKHESGFNPRAINNWDINAQNGDPSIGLFQIIGSTFSQYAMKGLGDRTNPVASAVAAIRYMDSRYGGIWGHPGIRSMMGGGGYKPYANGGIIDRPHMGLVGEAGPEAIIPLSSGKRSRALELYQQAGRALGVVPYANGGIVGGKYKVKYGDTLSELAVQFKTTVKNLMEMNKSIKSANKIYVGQYLKVSSSSSSSRKPAPKKPTYNREKSDALVSSNSNYMNYIQGMGLQNDSSYTTWKLRDKHNYFVNSSTDNKRSYNTQYADALRKYTSVSAAKSAFKGAGWFDLDKKYKDKLWKDIEASVKANIKAKYDDKANGVNDYVSYMQGMGAKGYDTPQYMTWKLKANESTFKNSSVETQKNYNTQMAQALRNYDDLEKARAKFEEAAWFGLNKQQKNSIWKGIEEAVKSNAFDKLNESTQKWLDTFNSGLKEANQKVSDWLSLVDDIKSQQESAKKDSFVSSTVAAGMESLGMGEQLTPEETIQKRMDEIKSEVENKLTQNAELAYANNPEEISKRLAEIDANRKKLQDQIKKTTDEAMKNGLSAADRTKLLQPMNDALAALNDEYNKINQSSADATTITNGNTEAVAALSKEYADLQAQLDGLTTDKMDEFGNIVRNLSGEVATGVVVTQSAAAQLASSWNSPASMVSKLPSTYFKGAGPVQQSDSAAVVTSEPKVYPAGKATSNTTIVIQTGVSVASESELKEFATLLNGMIKQEEGRGES